MFAFALLLAVSAGDASPRGPLVDAEPVWTGVFTGAASGVGAALGVGVLVEATVLTADNPQVGAVVDSVGLLLPIAGAAVAAFVVAALFLSPEDALLVGVLAGSAALAAGAVVMFTGAAFELAGRADAPPGDPLVLYIVAGSVVVVGSALAAGALANLLDETAYW